MINPDSQTTLPAIPDVPDDAPESLKTFLSALKEIVDVQQGRVVN